MIADNLIDTLNRFIGSLGFSSALTRVSLEVHVVFSLLTSFKSYTKIRVQCYWETGDRSNS